MTDTLSANAIALIDRPILATLATVSSDGAPQVTPLWIETQDGDLLINTAQGRAKARNIERDRRVAITVIDPENPYNVVALKGTVVEETTEGADDHIDRLAHKYMGVDKYPMRQEGEVRIILRIRPERIIMQP
jgi:PPOX class probable F420-dependent enzyme